MIKGTINEILSDIEKIESRDVIKESIALRLDQSFLLYNENLNKSYRDLLGTNYRKIIKGMSRGRKKR